MAVRRIQDYLLSEECHLPEIIKPATAGLEVPKKKVTINGMTLMPNKKCALNALV